MSVRIPMDDKRIEQIVRMILKSEKAKESKGANSKESLRKESVERRKRRDTQEKSQLELLASNIWSKLGDSSSHVKEIEPRVLRITVQDFSWKLTIKDDSRVTLSGFKSGAQQYVGTITEDNPESAIIQISENVIELIEEEVDLLDEEPREPIEFGEDPDELDDESLDPNEEMLMDAPSDPPIPPQPPLGEDVGATPMPQQPLGGDPMAGTPYEMPPTPGIPGPPQMDPSMGMTPPQMDSSMGMPQDPMMQQAPGGMPISRRASIRIGGTLDNVSEELLRISETLGESEDGALIELAMRIDRVNNTLGN